jgi:hypothetical protein
MPIYLEFDLRFLIERCGVTVSLPERRLNGLENVMAMLAKEWRGIRPLDPSRELRMSYSTRRAVLDWVEAAEPARGTAAQRLTAYEDVVDASVPEGWVRLLLG